MAKKNYDNPMKVKGTLEELEVLADGRETVFWAICKRLMARYVDSLRKISFKLLETDPNFIVRHTEMTGQALGLRTFINMVENSGKKLEKEEQKQHESV